MSDKSREVIVYLRQNLGGNTGKQFKLIQDYASKNNLKIIKVETEENKPGVVLSNILSDIKNQKYSHLLVWDLFSLTLSPVHLDSIFALLKKSNSHLSIVKDQLNTVNNRELVFDVGKMLLRFTIESQRLTIKKGQQQAKLSGRQIGRPGISKKDLSEALDLRRKGLSYRQIGRLLKLDESTVRKNLKKSVEL